MLHKYTMAERNHNHNHNHSHEWLGVTKEKPKN